jgi:hypothetical protein
MLEMYEEPIDRDFTLEELTTDELLRLLHEVADELQRRVEE